MNYNRNIARLIDHTILKPETTRAEVRQVCAEALRFGFASVCVNSFWVPLVAEALKNSEVRVCSVVGFPLGAASTEAKVAETLSAVTKGATEIDMVINVGALRGDEQFIVESDIAAVVSAARGHGAIVKVILETSLLDDAQKVLACELSKRAGAAFVKTSTGFGKSGATAEDIALMRRTVGPDLGVKASGGIRTLEDVLAMVAAGATRIGSSSGVKIVQSQENASAPGAAPDTY